MRASARITAVVAKKRQLDNGRLPAYDGWADRSVEERLCSLPTLFY